jgi:hypothetical protein
MGWIGGVCREKFRHTIVAQTFALIASVWPVLHRVSGCNKIVQRTSNMYKTHHNISLGYNGVDWVRSLWKSCTRLHGTNFWINCTSSACFGISFGTQQNGPKCTQRVRNVSKHVFMVQWGGSDAFVAKNSDTPSWNELFALHLFGPFYTEFCAIIKWSKTHRKCTKHTITLV